MTFPKDYAIVDNMEVVCDGNGHNSDCYLKARDNAVSSFGDSGWGGIVYNSDVVEGKLELWLKGSVDFGGTGWRLCLFASDSDYDNDKVKNYQFPISFRWDNANTMCVVENGNEIKSFSFRGSDWLYFSVEWWKEGGTYWIKIGDWIKSVDINPKSYGFIMYSSHVIFIDDIKLYRRWI